MLLIDAYNVLHVTGALPPELAGPDLPALASLIAASRYAREEALLVCDGGVTGAAEFSGRSGERGAVRVVYAGAGREADDLIEELLGRADIAGHPGRALVVSSDRRIRRAAGRRGARWLSSERFLEHLAADNIAARRTSSWAATAGKPAFTRDIPLDAGSVRHWLGVFGLSAEDEIMKLASSAGRAVSAKAPAQRREKAGAAEQPVAAPPPARGGESSPSAVPTDPILLEALKEWAGRLSLDDLDMSKWLRP